MASHLTLTLLLAALVAAATASPLLLSPAVVNSHRHQHQQQQQQLAADSELGRIAWIASTGNSVEATVALTNCSGAPCLLFGDFDAQVHAIHADTGKGGVWKKAYQAGEMIRSDIAVFGNSLFFIDGDSKLYSLAVDTGAEQWIFKTAAPAQQFASSSPAVVKAPGSDDIAIIIFGSVDGNVYGVNSSDGQQVWSFQTGGPIYASPTTVRDFVSGNTTVFIGSDDGVMYALNAVTGEMQWQFQTGDKVRSSNTYWIASRALYFGSNDGNLYALDVRTGAVIFQFATQSFITATPTLYELDSQNAILYIGSYDDYMYAINATNGSKIWSFKTNDNVIASATVYTASSGSGAGVPTLYFGGEDMVFYALDARSGSELWKYEVNTAIWSKPVIVQTATEALVVFGTQATPPPANDGSGVWALKTEL